MSDKVEVTPEAQAIVRLAIETVPAMSDEWQFRVAVRDRLATLVHMTSKASQECVRAQRLLDSKYVKGTLLSIEFEESSNRWVVTIASEGADAPEESFRTERKETALGKEHAARLANYIGVVCLFMLYLEPISGSKNKTARTLTHFIPHGKPTSRQSAQVSRDTSQSSGSDPGTAAASAAIMRNLSGPQRVIYARMLREEGVGNVSRVPEDKLNLAIEIADQIINAEP